MFAPPVGPGYTAYGSPPSVPGALGPWGQPVPIRGPYAASPPNGEAAAKAMLAQSVPVDLIQRVGYNTGPATPGGFPGMGGVPPGMGGVPPGMGGVPPGMGPMPGGGPPVMGGLGGGFAPGSVAAVGALNGGGAYTGQFAVSRTSVRFASERELYGMKVSWYTLNPDGKKGFSTTPLEIPGRYNFTQAAIYRLKLSDIPNYPAQELYPTLEVVPANSKTATFLAHSSVPVTFTRDDLRTVIEEGNYLVKVIYLPDPQYQDLAISGTGELISTQLQPGVDPIREACKRGSILAVIRLGNIDLEARHSPPMDAPPGGVPGYPTAPPANLPPGPRTMPPTGPSSVPPGIMPPAGYLGNGAGPGVPMMGPGGPPMNNR